MMIAKRSFLCFLLAVLCVISIFSCGSSVECDRHIDENSDGACDKCGASMTVCGESEHTDSDLNGLCDKCGAETEIYNKKKIELIEDGCANFQIVVGNNLKSTPRFLISSLVADLSSRGVEVKVVEDASSNETECEILVGEVSSRGEKYEFDRFSLGKKGYTLSSIDSKIIVTAGSDDYMVVALETLISNVFEEFLNSTKTDLTFSPDSARTYVQDDYLITSLFVGDRDVRGTTIAVDKRNPKHLVAANYLSDVIYTNTGRYLEVVSIYDSTDSSIIVRGALDDGVYGFCAYIEDASLVIDCAYDNRIEEAMEEFMEKTIVSGSGEIKFDSSYFFGKDIRTVRYEDFGAYGDGIRDDSEAFRRAHDFANAGGQVVVGKAGAKYLIKDPGKPIDIKSNVIWTGCEIIIDDRGIDLQSDKNVDVFRIASDYSQFTLTEDEARALFDGGKIDKDNFTRVNWNYGYKAIIIPKNENKKQYIRFPETNTGGAQQELLLIDEHGNVSKDTPCLFDFTDITSVTVIRVDDTPITIEGGVITTIANDTRCYKPSEMYSSIMYIKRGFSVERSGTTFKNVEHYVVGELSGENVDNNGPSYSGFYFIELTNDVTFDNCVFTDHKYYGLAGTYDFQVYFSNNTLFKDCRQSNFYLEDGVTPRLHNGGWGLMGSNFCKNLTYDGCLIARLDAHAGLYNGKVINSTVCVVEIIGGGDMLIENTKFVPTRNIIVDLRTDYGATWNGNITIKNCEVLRNFKPEDTCVFAATWYNFDFGYTCHMPGIVIDGLKFDRVVGDIQIFNSPVNKTELMNSPTLLDGTVNKNQYQPPKYIKVYNNDEGYSYKLYDIPFFDNVILEGVTK